MLVKSLSFLASLCCVATLPALPPLPFLLLSLPALLVLFVLRHKLRGVGIVVAFFICGFVYGCLVAASYLSQRLPPELRGVEVEIVATIVDLPHRDGRRLRFLSQLESIKLLQDAAPVARSGRIRLTWYGYDAPDLRAGDKVKLVVKLKAPAGFMNPGGFDRERWFAQKKTIATGYVRSKSFDVTQSVTGHSFTPLATARNTLQIKLAQASESYQSQGVIAALTVGDRSGITPGLWQDFISTGTNHLLAISGLHISLVAGFFALLVQYLWRYTGLVSRSTRRGCAVTVALLAAFCYAAMAGFSVPTVRALMMFSVLVCLLLVRRHQRRTQSLAIALMVVCITDPLSVLSPGFWMSFAAVAVLYLVFSNSQPVGRAAMLTRVLRGHVLITVGLYPLTILFFSQASLISPLANLVVTPLIGMIVTPLVFIAALLVFVSMPLASALLFVVDILLRASFSLLDYLAGLPLALIKISGVSSIAIIFFTGTAVLMLIPLTRSVRSISFILLLPLLFPKSTPDLAAGEYKVTVLDVGQGLSVVVTTASHTLVYDTGDQFSSRFSAADAVLLPYLRHESITTIDRLIVSHADRDHSGGADEVLAEMQVALLMLSDKLSNIPGTPYRQCLAGDSWIWDQVTFTILHPQLNATGSGNDRSCVLMIATPDGVRTLLPGDIESAAERQLLAAGTLEPVAVLLSPHHGSATSSGDAFLDVLQPEYALHSAGYKNRFGFPRPEVTARYESMGVQQFTTAASGAIEVQVSDSGIQLSEYRLTAKRWWHR